MQVIDEHCARGHGNCRGTKESTQYDVCYKMSDGGLTSREFFLSFPDIAVKVGDVLINWSPSEYFVTDVNDPRKHCIGLDHQVYGFPRGYAAE